jgi:hypothetical protein
MKLQWNKVSLNIKTEISPRKDVAEIRLVASNFQVTTQAGQGRRPEASYPVW